SVGRILHHVCPLPSTPYRYITPHFDVLQNENESSTYLYAVISSTIHPVCPMRPFRSSCSSSRLQSISSPSPAAEMAVHLGSRSVRRPDPVLDTGAAVTRWDIN